jgi:hypothetical protein
VKTAKTNAFPSLDKFIESQLFLIGPNLLAQYWVEFGHVSYFERVNIDDFLDPERAMAD